MNDARLVRFLTPWERRHPRLCARVRAVAGVSLLIVSAILIGYDVWWGVLLVPVAHWPSTPSAASLKQSARRRIQRTVSDGRAAGRPAFSPGRSSREAGMVTR